MLKIVHVSVDVYKLLLDSFVNTLFEKHKYIWPMWCFIGGDASLGLLGTRHFAVPWVRIEKLLQSSCTCRCTESPKPGPDRKTALLPSFALQG